MFEELEIKQELIKTNALLKELVEVIKWTTNYVSPGDNDNSPDSKLIIDDPEEDAKAEHLEEFRHSGYSWEQWT